MTREARGQTAIVCDHHDGLAMFAHQLLEDVEDVVSRQRVEAACRLIGDQDGWIISQGARNGHALLLTARDVRGQFLGMLFQFDQLQQLHGTLPALARIVESAQVHGQGDILDQGQHGQQLKGLIDDPQVLPAPQGQRIFAQFVDGNGLAIGVNDDLATGEMVHAVEHVEQRGLARTGLAHHAEKFPRVDLGIDPPQGGKLTRRGGIDFDDIAQFDNGIHGVKCQWLPVPDNKPQPKPTAES